MDLSDHPTSSRRLSWVAWCVQFVAFLVLMVSVQSWHGAYHSDLAEDPDEAAHAVTSLMVRDYLATAPGSNPMRYAQSYYERLPKVALGHYPPGFYMVAGIFLLPVPTLGALFFLQAAIVASLAATSARWSAGMLPSWVGWLVGVAVCLAAPMQKVSVLIMSDFLLALLSLLSVGCLWRYVERPKVLWALGFGFLAAAAILTKGSGWMLALAPALIIALTRKWSLLWKPSLWVAPLPVLALALPWQMYSYRFTEEGMSGLGLREHFLHAVKFYAISFQDSFGWPFIILGVAAVIMMLVRWLRGGALQPGEAALWALIGSAVVLVLTVPAGVSSRYLVPMTPPLLLTVAMAIWMVNFGKVQTWMRVGLLALAGVSLVLGCSHKDLKKDVHGYSAAVDKLVSDTVQHDGAAWLVCADARGEGAIIAAAAFDKQLRGLPGFHVLRATKELASMDWIGRSYEGAFASNQELRTHLEKRQARWVLLDDSVPPPYRQPHFDQLHQALTEKDSGWTLAHTVQVVRWDGAKGDLHLFTRAPQQADPK